MLNGIFGRRRLEDGGCRQKIEQSGPRLSEGRRSRA